MAPVVPDAVAVADAADLDLAVRAEAIRLRKRLQAPLPRHPTGRQVNRRTGQRANRPTGKQANRRTGMQTPLADRAAVKVAVAEPDSAAAASLAEAAADAAVPSSRRA